jgi:DNA-binding NarL/FixJ family response regulator
MSKRVGKFTKPARTRAGPGATLERRLRSAEIQVDRLLRAIRSLRQSMAVVEAPGRRKARHSAKPDLSVKSEKPSEELVAALAKVLKGRSMGPSEAAARVKRAGYRATTRGFVENVKRALMTSARFRSVGVDKFTARDGRSK